MVRPRSQYITALIFVVIGVYFLLYSDYPLFIILFWGLAVYQFFITRLLIKWQKKVSNNPVTEESGAEHEPDQAKSCPPGGDMNA